MGAAPSLLPDTDAFPAGEVAPPHIRFLLHYAILAPSGHNTQPWRFRISGEPNADAVEVLADRSRALPVVDPDDRALTISCGAAVGMLEAAARGFGVDASVTRMPDPSQPELLARVQLQRRIGTPAPRDVALRDAIGARRTDRRKYLMQALEPEAVAAATAMARELGVEVAVCADVETRAALAGLVARGDRAQFADARFRRELGNWIRGRAFGSRDGLSGSGFGMPDALSPVGRFAIARFNMGDVVAAEDEAKITEATPLMLVLGTETDAPAAWVDAGRALARLSLSLAADGITLAHVNQPVEVSELRPEVRAAAKMKGHPQLMLRVGRTGKPPTPATARRPLPEVLLEAR